MKNSSHVIRLTRRMNRDPSSLSVHGLQEYIQERQKHFSNNVAKIPGIITDKSRYTMTSEALSPNQQ
ncbi:hypothetical protein DTO217A2_4593 [Paecilomyces variotii]|nr:hypothetical protein DTO217A2_4593 [Paecilomyces variotii]